MNLLGLLLLVTEPAPPSESPPQDLAPTVVDGAENEVPIVDPSVRPATEPHHDALEHLLRAQQHEASGMLEAAEAEASTAIALQPDDAPSYLVRAQIRMGMADRMQGEDAATLRSKATLLRLSADDVASYLEYAELPRDGAAWFESRRQGLLRDAEALDPVAPEPRIEPVRLDPPPEPALSIAPEIAPPRDHDGRRRTAALVSTGAVAGAAAVGLSAASLHIEQRCAADGLCAVRWQPQASLLAPAVALAAIGTTSIVVGLATSPAMDRAGPRRAVIGTTIGLGSAAAVVGTITGALAGAQWFAPVSPSDTAALGTTQTLSNVAVASFAAALPLVSAGITAWVRGRRHRETTRMAGRHARSWAF